MSYDSIGKTLPLLAGVIAVMGLVFFFLGKAPIKIPGDIFITRGKLSFAFPIVSSIIASVVLRLLLNFVIRLWHK